ncbi:hypothetical protein EUX98_g6606 [Antrodiella citrinella]|uniref:Extracellular membrane protein CFEM domain-containing protein n=1 Tax=Antrodiella citrinella TaxID=2447956 RepID=A0A4S4MPD5_9APHY|nr:hypothetical protein EUX98_g6606 [Antrodiella citrinella]
MFALCLVSVALLAGHASAFTIQERSVLHHVYTRQTAGGGFNPAEIPQQCQSACATAVPILSGQGCQTNQCLCTSAVNTGFEQCLDCVLSLAPADPTLTSETQQALSQYEDQCALVGFPLSSLTLSGATVAPTSAGGSVTIPPNSGSAASPSVFFSSSGAPPASVPSSPAASTLVAPPPPVTPTPDNTRSVIGPSSPTSGANTPAPAVPTPNPAAYEGAKKLNTDPISSPRHTASTEPLSPFTTTTRPVATAVATEAALMVHRPADSRLLVNLLTHEKDYSKQLANLLDHSQASLTSFSAYASASAPPTSQIIVSIAGILYGADEAFRKYAAAVDQWQLQLKALKEMEDGLANIIRDREILVTRLIKASKNSKPPTRDNIPSSSSSTLSYNGLKHPEVQVGTKLSAAQTELQACEAHLANKERELDAFRTATIRSGLQARCRALVECGWAWGEMGKEGIRSLDMFDVPNGNGHPASLPLLPNLKPLPDLSGDNPSSDHSSLAPSQSASQIGPVGIISPSSTQYTLTIGPAHSISELTMPNGTAYHTQPPRIAEEPGGSSAEEGDPHQDVRVVENERFMPSRKPKGQGPPRAHVRTVSSEARPARHITFPSSTSDTFLLRSPTGDTDKEKRGSIRRGFGSIAALFRGKGGGSNADPESPTAATGGRKWKTRTDKNLKRVGKGGETSDEEDLQRRQHLGGLGPSVSAPVIQDVPDAATRSRKRLKRGSAVPPKRDGNEGGDIRNWASEGEETVRGRNAKPAEVNMNLDSDAEPSSPSAPAPSQPQATSSQPTRAPLEFFHVEAEHDVCTGGIETCQHIHALPYDDERHFHSTKTYFLCPRRLGPAVTPGAGKQAGSSHPSRPATADKPAQRAAESGMNLMSIVGGFLPKAPPPVSELLELENQRERDEKQAEENMKAIAAAAVLAADPSTEPPTPTTATTVQSLPTEQDMRPPPTVMHKPPDRDHAAKPLRSALRNASPSPLSSPSLKPVAGSSKMRSLSIPPPRPDRSPKRAAVEMPVVDEDENDGDDAASISSYETGHEVIDEEPGIRTPSPVAPLPPPHDQKPNHLTNGHSDLSQSTDSTVDASGAPRRRKSVRMSLPPTFSTTPPAIYEEEPSEGGKGRHEPWSSQVKRRPRPAADPVAVSEASHTKRGGWSTRITDPPTTEDVWGDSSEEDEEYGRAKRLLSKFSGRR